MESMLDTTTRLLFDQHEPKLTGSTMVGAVLLIHLLFTLWKKSTTTTTATTTKKKKSTKKPWPTVLGRLPLVGHFHLVGDPSNLVNKCEEWAQVYGKETGCFEINLMGVSFVVVCNEERVQEVLRHRPHGVIRNRQMTAAARSVGADGLFAAEHHQWQQDRRHVAPTFNHNQLRNYIPHFHTVMQRLVDKWTNDSTTTNDVVINRDLFCYALDTTALTTLGKDYDTLRTGEGTTTTNNKNIQEGKDLQLMLRKVKGSVRVISPVAYWRIPLIGQYLDGMGWSINRLIKSTSQIVDNLRRTNDKNNNDDNDDAFFIKKMVRREARRSSPPSSSLPSLDRHRIIGNALTLIMAGTDSSHSTLCSIVQTLAQDETGLQQELYDEIHTQLLHDGKDIGSLTLDDLLLHNNSSSNSHIPRLKSFLYEVFRFHPAFPFLMFRSERDIPLAGSTLPKGTEIMSLLRYSSVTNPHSPPTDVARGPNNVDPTVFCPRRFLVQGNSDDDDKVGVRLPSRNSTSFLTFGHGSRVCVGKTYAEASVLLFIIYLIDNFESIRLAPNHEPIGRTTVMASLPDRDVRVALTPRKQQQQQT